MKKKTTRGRKTLTKKHAMDSGPIGVTFGAMGGDEAMTDPLFLSTINFARNLLDVSKWYAGAGCLTEQSQALARASDFQIKSIINFLVSVVTNGSEQKFSGQLLKVYKTGIDRADAFPELFAIPHAWGEARSNNPPRPRVSDVQDRLRVWGVSMDEDTLRKHLKKLKLAVRNQGEH